MSDIPYHIIGDIMVETGEILDKLNLEQPLTYEQLKHEVRWSEGVPGKIQGLIETGHIALQINPAQIQRTDMEKHMYTWDMKEYCNSPLWLEYMYAEEGKSLQDIGDICDLTRESIRYRMNKLNIDVRRNAGSQAKPTKNKGYVYILGGNGYHKIGSSQYKRKRARTVGSHLPFETEIILTIPTDHRLNLEQKLQNKYSDKRTKGEWYELTEGDIKEIKSEYT